MEAIQTSSFGIITVLFAMIFAIAILILWVIMLFMNKRQEDNRSDKIGLDSSTNPLNISCSENNPRGAVSANNISPTVLSSVSVNGQASPSFPPPADFWSQIHNLNLINFLKVVLHCWYWLVLWFAFSVVGVWHISVNQPVIWQADSRVMIVQPMETEEGSGLNPYLADQAALSVAKTIVQIIYTEDFQDEVFKSALQDSDYIPQNELRWSLKKKTWQSLSLGRRLIISGENIKSTTVITLSAVAGDRVSAKIIVQNAADLLKQRVNTYFPKYDSELINIEPAILLDEPVFPQTGRNLVIGFILSLALGMIICYSVADAKIHHNKN